MIYRYNNNNCIYYKSSVARGNFVVEQEASGVYIVICNPNASLSQRATVGNRSIITTKELVWRCLLKRVNRFRKRRSRNSKDRGVNRERSHWVLITSASSLLAALARQKEALHTLQSQVQFCAERASVGE